jgi:hypothetical protein
VDRLGPNQLPVPTRTPGMGMPGGCGSDWLTHTKDGQYATFPRFVKEFINAVVAISVLPRRIGGAQARIQTAPFAQAQVQSGRCLAGQDKFSGLAAG